jgi:hypothetical protein
MKKKSLNGNYKSKEFVFFNEMDHEIQNAKILIHKFEVGLLVVLVDSTDVFTHSSYVWVQLTNIST